MPPVSGTSAVVASFAFCQSRVAIHTWNETDFWLHSAAEVYFSCCGFVCNLCQSRVAIHTWNETDVLAALRC